MSNEIIISLASATLETLYMVLVSAAIAALFGIPIGILVHTSQENGILENKSLNRILTWLINGLRSIPFIILMVAIIPLTRFLIGTSIGTTAAIVPLAVAAIPFVARLIDNVLRELPSGLVEAGLSFGATPLQIIYRILLPESLSGIINAMTVTVVTLVGYSAMAGAIGGGGLGDLAIRYGYERFNILVMAYTVVILIVMVQLIQWLGDRLSVYLSHRRYL